LLVFAFPLYSDSKVTIRRMLRDLLVNYFCDTSLIAFEEKRNSFL
jgi:hypothetical protein